MSPLDRGPREHSETCSNVPIRPARAAKRHFPRFPAPARAPPEPRKTNRGHLATKMPRSSPENSPSSESGSRAFQNTFKGPNSTIFLAPMPTFRTAQGGRRRAKRKSGRPLPDAAPMGSRKRPHRTERLYPSEPPPQELLAQSLPVLERASRRPFLERGGPSSHPREGHADAPPRSRGISGRRSVRRGQPQRPALRPPREAAAAALCPGGKQQWPRTVPQGKYRQPRPAPPREAAVAAPRPHRVAVAGAPPPRERS